MNRSLQSTAPKKNVQFTNRRNERQTNNNNFIGLHVYKGPAYKANLTSEYIAYQFEVLWTFSAMSEPIDLLLT